MNLSSIPIEYILDSLPQNRPLYKDSGLWQVRTDDMESVIAQQKHDDTFREFIIRYCEYLVGEDKIYFETELMLKKK
jgi:hypothetical protein